VVYLHLWARVGDKTKRGTEQRLYCNSNLVELNYIKRIASKAQIRKKRKREKNKNKNY
jgi:hypothetical protein